MKSGSVIAFAAVSASGFGVGSGVPGVAGKYLSLYNFKRFTQRAVLALERSALVKLPAVPPNATASAKTVSAIMLLIVRIIKASALIVIDFSTAA